MLILLESDRFLKFESRVNVIYITQTFQLPGRKLTTADMAVFVASIHIEFLPNQTIGLIST